MGAGASVNIEEIVSDGIRYVESKEGDIEISKSLKKILKMKKAGVDLGACIQSAKVVDKLSENTIKSFLLWMKENSKISSQDLVNVFPKHSDLLI